MRYEKKLDRRTFLRGAGTVVIALPFLDAMRSTSVYAAAPEPVARAINVFHGLGVPTPIQGEGLGGPLEPLGLVGRKLSILRGVNQRRCDEGGSNAHYDGAAGAFTAARPDGAARAGGPSLDQLIRRNEEGAVAPTVLAGTYFRRGERPARYLHSWNPDGTAAGVMHESPAALFERVFGTDPSMSGGVSVEEARRKRLRRSVLDSVVEQYRFWQSDASGLGMGARTRIATHLEKIREYEMRAFGMAGECTIPDAPGDSPVPHGGAADPGGSGIDTTVEALTSEWRLLSDIYVLGLQCDRFRFGCVTFQAAGERIRLRGQYDYEGTRRYDFDDAGERSGRSGDQACSHEWWHEFGADRANTQLRAHVHLMMNEIA